MQKRNRRNFIGTLLAAGAAFSLLPSWKFERRLWVPGRRIVRCDFTQFFSDQPPLFDEAILL